MNFQSKQDGLGFGSRILKFQIHCVIGLLIVPSIQSLISVVLTIKARCVTVVEVDLFESQRIGEKGNYRSNPVK